MMIMTRRFFVSLALLFTFNSFSCSGEKISSPDGKERVAVVDLDDVVSIKGKVGMRDFWSLPISWGTLASLAMDYKAISEKGDQIAKTTEGTSNIVEQMLVWLEEEKGYKGLLGLRDDIVSRIVKPVPIVGVVKTLDDLKEQGVRIVGATNQDYETHMVWREEMKKQGVDVDELFDAVLTTRGASMVKDQQTANPVMYHSTHHVFEISDGAIKKPDQRYYHILQQTILPRITTTPHATKVFTDDKPENVDGASLSGIDAIRFPLPEDPKKKG